MRILLLVILCSAASLAQAATDVKFTHAKGPHAVGVRIVQQYDHSRGIDSDIDAFGVSKHGERARPMQTIVWYPAQASGAAPLKVVDYVLSNMTEYNFALPAAAIDATRVKLLADPANGAMLAKPMWASRDAAGVAGKFPVLIYAPSFAATAAENSDLCEYLASHGYVVLASRSTGPRSKEMTDDLEGLDAQAADIAYLMAYANTLPQADSSKLAAIGFSWGGLANVMAAARSSRIKALVSLDGTVRTQIQHTAGVSYLTPARTAVPMLSIGSRPMSLEELHQKGRSVATSYLNGMKYSDVYTATMQPMTHMNFASLSLRTDPDSRFTEYTRDEAANAYSWTARYVKEFLDAYLKQDAAALAFMKNSPAQNGVPRHMMALEQRPASVPVPNDATFIKTFMAGEYKDAQGVYKQMLAQSPGFSLNPLKLNTWGYQLLRKNNPKGGLELFKLASFLEPGWGDVLDSQGEAYEALGEKELALRAYEQAVAADKKQTNAAARIKALRQAQQ